MRVVFNQNFLARSEKGIAQYDTDCVPPVGATVTVQDMDGRVVTEKVESVNYLFFDSGQVVHVKLSGQA